MLMIYLSMLEDDSDKALFSKIYKTYEKKMYKTAFAILHEKQKAEDAVHDSFIKIIRHFEKCRAIRRNELDGWIVIIVKNTALDYIKKDKRLLDTDEFWDIASRNNTESESGYRRLVEIIRSMPDSTRSLLELKYVLEWSNTEIARHFGINENAVAARLFRARKNLLKKLEEEGYHRDGQPV